MADTNKEQGAQILLVDDEENILKALQRLLLYEGYEVLTAPSGLDGIWVLQTNPGVAVIVSDQQMPGMSGVEFLESARQIAPEAVRLVLTGYSSKEAAIDAINRGGVHRYIEKPWKDDEMIATIRDAVQRFELIAENRRLTEIVQQQNTQLRNWNETLEARVVDQTALIRGKSIALEELNEALKRNFRDVIMAFSNLVDIRNKTVGNHSRKVGEVAREMAVALNLSQNEVAVIAVAALLHDIGKVALPDILLDKDPTEMSPAEMAEYVQHPVRGQTAVDAVEDLREAGGLIRHHHEKFNGTGFPDKLKGPAIPLGARVIAFADFIDRTIARQGPGKDMIETTLRITRKEYGNRLDPSLYPLMEKLIPEAYDNLIAVEDLGEIELRPKDLGEGMVLSRDLKSGTGVLLLSRGIPLDRKSIEAIRRYNSMDPIKGGVYVWMKK